MTSELYRASLDAVKLAAWDALEARALAELRALRASNVVLVPRHDDPEPETIHEPDDGTESETT